MIHRNKNLTYALAALMLATITACTDDEQGYTSSGTANSAITFLGLVEHTNEIVTRKSTPINSTDNSYGDIYIRQQIDEETPTIQVYTASSGQQGELETKGEGDPLKWTSVTAEHTFYAWTQPNVPNEENFIGGVKMDEPENVETYSTTGTVTFGTQGNTDLEHFIVAKTGPLSYDENNQYVGLHFYRPVAKIKLNSVTHVRSDQSYEDIGECTITFPNLPTTAKFNAIFTTYTDNKEKYPEVLTGSTTEKGITWPWKKGDDAYMLYVPPFEFSDEDITNDYEQPGYFIVQTGNTTYTGTLANVNSPTELKGGDYMQLDLQVADGSVTGIYSNIKEWNTEGNEDVPQHRIPGIYTQEDAEALLNALLNYTDIPAYLIDGEEGETQTIRFFTHVDWESLLKEEEVESITIPQKYILDGQGYNLILPKDVNLYGVKEEDEAGNIKHLYVNGDEYTVVEEPDPDTEPDEGTGEDGTGGTGNPDAGTTPETSETEDPATGDNTANT